MPLLHSSRRREKTIPGTLAGTLRSKCSDRHFGNDLEDRPDWGLSAPCTVIDGLSKGALEKNSVEHGKPEVHLLGELALAPLP